MEITQFTYFQQCGGFECRPVSAELTYGLERIAMYLQNVENVFDVEWVKGVTYGEVFHRNEVEMSTYAFRASDPAVLFALFDIYEKECKRLLGAGAAAAGLRVGAQVLAHLQPARRARGDQRHRARRVHQAGAGQRPRLRRGVPQGARELGFPLREDGVDGRPAASAARGRAGQPSLGRRSGAERKR